MPSDTQALAESHWYDLPYWLKNFSQVRLNPSDNPHVVPRALRVAWTSPDAPPIVAVEFLPRKLEVEARPQGAGDILTGVSAVVGLVIPGLGAAAQAVTRAAITAANIGAGVQHNLALRDWADSFHAAPDEFGPQYSPEAFTVPMPLDRAQIMVSRPWYGPAMVYQFAQELQTGKLRTTAQAYRDLLQAMLPAGWADPAPYGFGEAPLFRFVNPLLLPEPKPEIRDQRSEVSQTAEVRGQRSEVSQTAAPTAMGSLPLLVAGGLLIAGAPIVLVVVVGVAMLGIGKAK